MWPKLTIRKYYELYLIHSSVLSLHRVLLDDLLFPQRLVAPLPSTRPTFPENASPIQKVHIFIGSGHRAVKERILLEILSFSSFGRSRGSRDQLDATVFAPVLYVSFDGVVFDLMERWGDTILYCFAELAMRRVMLHGGIYSFDTCVDVLRDIAHFTISGVARGEVEALVEDRLLVALETLLLIACVNDQIPAGLK